MDGLASVVVPEVRSQNRLTFALYARIRSKPVLHVAKRLGLSDRGLGKLCAHHKIPVPPRGRWP